MLLHQRANHQSCRPEKQKPQKINMRVATSQHETGSKNHIVCTVKMQTPPEHNLPVRKNIHWKKQHFRSM